MQCPKCRQVMNQVQVDDLAVDICPGCDGTWYDGDELPRILQASYYTLAASPLGPALIGDQEDAPPKSGDHLSCPRCGRPMEKLQYVTGCDVEADRCPEHGVYLDDGELSRLFEFWRQTHPAGPAAPLATTTSALGRLRGLMSGWLKRS